MAVIVTVLVAACAPAAPSPAAAPTPTAAPAAAKPAATSAPAQGATAAAPTQASGGAISSVKEGILGPNALNWVEFVADKRGFFQGEGIQVEFVLVKDGAAAAQQMASGDLQLSGIGLDPVMRGIEGGADIEVIAGEVRVPPYNLVVQPDIKAWSDLKGKKVIIGGPKDPTLYFVAKMFDANGLKLDDVDMVYGGSSNDRFAALQSGAVSAAILTQPLDLNAIGQGKPTLGWAGDYITTYPASGMGVNRSWANSHPDEIGRYLRAMVRAADWLTNTANKEDAVSVMNEVAPQNTDYLRQSYELYFEKGKSVLYPRLKLEPSDVESLLDARVFLGEERPTVPTSRYLDSSFLEKAIAAVGP